MRFLLPTLVVSTLALCALSGTAHAQSGDCPNPWVVVVKTDGSVVEGKLVREIERGVLVDVGGRTTLVPDEQIEEVVEDCSRAAAPGVGAAQPQAPAAPPVARPAPAPRSRAAVAADSFRNSVIMAGQMGMRLVGGACMSLGLTICSIGVVTALTLFIGSLGQGLENALVLTLLALAIFGGAAAVFWGSGAGLLVGAQMAGALRTDDGGTPSMPDMGEAPREQKDKLASTPEGRQVAATEGGTQAY
ncbi:MAG: hypothetical protein AB2A00_41920 [Myxococcota bacterium]